MGAFRDLAPVSRLCIDFEISHVPRHERACILGLLPGHLHKNFPQQESWFLMPSYMVQVSYSPQALSALIANPQDRAQALKKNVRNLGGKVTGSWFSFGEYDLVMIAEFPDNVSAAAWALAVAGGGALKSVKTTPLMSIEEGLEAFKKVPESGYKSIVAS
jgi:uncharacterized protein with GYD domain